MNRSKVKNLSLWVPTKEEKERLEGCTKKYIVQAYVYNLDVNAGKAEGEKEPILILNFHSLSDDNKAPDFRVFLSKSDYITEMVALSSGKTQWKTGRLESVLFSGWYKACACIDDSSETEMREFFDYLGKGNLFLLVEGLQQKIMAERLLRKHREEEAKIDKELEGFPDVPHDLKHWTQTEVMVESRYIYYTYEKGKKTQEGFCTHCQHDVEVVPRHKHQGVCPNCESKVTYQASVRSALFTDQQQVVCMQKWKEGFVARYFYLSKNYNDPRDPEVKLFEVYREVYNKTGQVEVYEMRKHPVTEKVRWYRDSKVYYYARASVYPVGVREAMAGTVYQYSALEVFIENGNHDIDVYKYLKLYKTYNSVEYLVKLGLTKLVKELVHHVPYNISLNLKGKNLKDIMQVGKERVEQLRQIDAGISGHELVVKMDQANLHVPTEELLAIKDKIGLPTLKELIPYVSVEGEKKMGSLHKITKYLMSFEMKPSYTFNLWEDYIKFAKELEYPLDRDFTIFPRNLEAAHNTAFARLDYGKSKKQREKRKRLEEDARTLLKAQEEQYNYEGEKFLVKAPEKLLDILKEGCMLSHCVGSYVEDVAIGNTVILFLREILEPSKPFYTIEVRNGIVRQCRGFDNKQPTSEIEKFLEKFQKKKLGQRAS